MRAKMLACLTAMLLAATLALAGCAGMGDRKTAEGPSPQTRPSSPENPGPVRPTVRYEPPMLPVTTLADWEGTPYDDAAAGDAAALLEGSALVVVARLLGPERVYERPNAGWGYTSFSFAVEQVLKGDCQDALLHVLSPLTPRQFADAYNGYVDHGTLTSEMSVYTTLFPLPPGRRVLLMLRSVESPQLLGGRAWACNGLRSTVLLVGDDGSLSPSDWVDAGGSYQPDPALRSLDDVPALLAQQPQGVLTDPGDAPAGVYTGSVVYWRDAGAALLKDKELARYPQIRTVRSFAELTAAVQADPGAAIWIDHTLAAGATPQWFARKPQRTLPVVLVGCYDSAYAFTSVLPIEAQFHEVGVTVTYGEEEKKPLGSGFSVFRCAAETPELEDPVQLQITQHDELSVTGIFGELEGMFGSTAPDKGSDAWYIGIAADALNLDLTPGGDRTLVEQSPYTLRQETAGGDGITWTVRVIPYGSLRWLPPAMGSPQDATVMVSILEDDQSQGMHRLTLHQAHINPKQKVDSVYPFTQPLTHNGFVSLSDAELAAAQVLSQCVMDEFPLSGSVTATGCVGTGPDGHDVLLNDTASTQATPLGSGRCRVLFTRCQDILAEPMAFGDDQRYLEKPESFSVLRTLTSTWEYELVDGRAEAVRISVKSLNGMFDVEWGR